MIKMVLLCGESTLKEKYILHFNFTIEMPTKMYASTVVLSLTMYCKCVCKLQKSLTVRAMPSSILLVRFSSFLFISFFISLL